MEIARAGAAIRGNRFQGFLDERVGTGVEGRVVAGAGNVLGAEFDAVARGELGFERADDGLDLGVVNEGGLKTLEAAEAGWAEEHIPAALEGFGPLAVEDGARVDLRGDLKGDARGVVGFNNAGDDVDGRALGREDGVDADCARHLREAGDGRLDVLGGGHHEVGEFVDDEDDVRQFREALGDRLGIVAGEIADGFFGEDGVAALHFADEPLQGLDGLLGIGDDRMDEVREIAIDGELDDLGVDEDEFEFVGAEAVNQRKNEIADTD